MGWRMSGRAEVNGINWLRPMNADTSSAYLPSAYAAPQAGMVLAEGEGLLARRVVVGFFIRVSADSHKIPQRGPSSAGRGPQWVPSRDSSGGPISCSARRSARNETMRGLIYQVTRKDFRVDYFSGTWAGGQYRNKHQNCVRLTHNETGIVTTGQEQRSREQNLRDAAGSN